MVFWIINVVEISFVVVILGWLFWVLWILVDEWVVVLVFVLCVFLMLIDEFQVFYVVCWLWFKWMLLSCKVWCQWYVCELIDLFVVVIMVILCCVDEMGDVIIVCGGIGQLLVYFG